MKTKIKKFIKSESGFTLIELLVVIGIIAILATIGAVNFSGARAQARDGKRSADLSQIRSSIEAAAAGSVTGLYPTTAPADLGALANTTSPNTAYCYYTNTAQTAYVVAAIGVERQELADSAQYSDVANAVNGNTANLNTISATGIACPAVGAVFSCTADNGGGTTPLATDDTICQTGTTAL